VYRRFDASVARLAPNTWSGGLLVCAFLAPTPLHLSTFPTSIRSSYLEALPCPSFQKVENSFLSYHLTEKINQLQKQQNCSFMGTAGNPYRNLSDWIYGVFLFISVAISTPGYRSENNPGDRWIRTHTVRRSGTLPYRSGPGPYHYAIMGCDHRIKMANFS